MNKTQYERITHHREPIDAVGNGGTFAVVSSLIYVERGCVHALGTLVIVTQEDYRGKWNWDWRRAGKETFDRALEACSWSPPVLFHVERAPAWWG